MQTPKLYATCKTLLESHPGLWTKKAERDLHYFLTKQLGKSVADNFMSWYKTTRS